MRHACMAHGGRGMASEGVCGAKNVCRSAVEKKTVLENLDLVLLVMDETVDGG